MLTQTVSVVVPVFRATEGLGDLVRELTGAAGSIAVAEGAELVLSEVVLVCDNPALAPAERSRLIDLELSDPRVQVLWLSTNFGQHPATVAGIVSTNGDWVVTMDEDGQHDPAAIPRMAAAAAAAGAGAGASATAAATGRTTASPR